MTHYRRLKSFFFLKSLCEKVFSTPKALKNIILDSRPRLKRTFFSFPLKENNWCAYRTWKGPSQRLSPLLGNSEEFCLCRRKQRGQKGRRRAVYFCPLTIRRLILLSEASQRARWHSLHAEIFMLTARGVCRHAESVNFGSLKLERGRRSASWFLFQVFHCFQLHRLQTRYVRKCFPKKRNVFSLWYRNAPLGALQDLFDNVFSIF